MNVVNMAVYKEAKLNKEFRERVRQEKIKHKLEMVQKAIPFLQEDQFEDLAGTIYDGDASEISEKVDELFFTGGLILALEKQIDYEVMV